MLLRRFAVGRSVLPLLLISSAASLLPGACRDVVAGDGIDAARELCELLENCYGDDAVFGSCEAFASKLEQAPAATRQSFLAELDLGKCLESCPAARQCMDVLPYCGESPACDDELDCCGWSEGTSACESGRCCSPLGIACDDSADCCQGTCDNGTCGGRPCSTIDEACDTGDECCSGICREGVCAIRDCALVAEACSLGTDCCAAEEQGYEPGTLVECTNGACSPILDQPCQEEFLPCDPGVIECCPNYQCIPDGVDGFYCSSGGVCAILGESCDGVPCCDGVCDTESFPPFCVPPTECLPDLETCGTDVDCCSGYCQKGQPTNPTGQCAPCFGNSCLHNPCDSGDPMVPEACEDAIAECVGIVTQIDSWCRCTEWDSLCVGRAMENCVNPCATPF